ncbi:hypothetical protein RB653_005413 [Dictyostelium firmibasis]|uniref:methenyltetrahydrofolate cyclohydrolase n=1 Tax=Dictyostelium firmibasis TaxID=79012 RepID=A0AAN7U9G1_9MYCE
MMLFRGFKSLNRCPSNISNVLIGNNQSFKRFTIPTTKTTSSLLSFRNFTTNNIESTSTNNTNPSTTTTNIPLSASQTEKKPTKPFEPIKLDGKLLSSYIKRSIKSDTDDFVKNSGITPNLVVIYVGDSKQIESYIKAKRKGCEDVGIKFTLDRFSSDITEEQLIKKIRYHSEDPSVHGIIVQLPLPENLNRDTIIQSIDPKKDVDGLTSTNLGQIMISKRPLYIPCTPLGILEILKAYNIKVEGKNVVVLGRSNLVGRTIATILSQKDLTNPSIMNGANVTVIHKYSKNHHESIGQADLIISATGVPGLIKKENLKRGVILIDVGISYKEDSTKKSGYKMVGDIDPEAYSRSIAYTPVPGGVGPLTVACLLRNVLRSAILQYRIQSARISAAVDNKFTVKNQNENEINNNNNNNSNNNNNNVNSNRDDNKNNNADKIPHKKNNNINKKSRK